MPLRYRRILEIALLLAKLNINPVNKIRFAFRGAVDDGLIGSQFYVDDLPKQELNDLMLNLNFDMVGSPNFVRFVYDGDGSAFGTDGPSGSGTIEDAFNDYFASQGLATDPTEFDGRSDYDGAYQRWYPRGRPLHRSGGHQDGSVGGCLRWHGCYHQRCDTLRNLSGLALDQMSDAAAHATLLFAMTNSSVSGTDNANNPAAVAARFKGPHAKKGCTEYGSHQ